MSTTLALTAATAAVALAVVACGMPRTAWADDNGGLMTEAAKADAKQIKRILGTAAAIALGALLEFWAAPGAWVALALASAVGVPIAIDRWRRTHGSASPLRTLLAQEPPTEAPRKPREVVEALLPLLRTLTDAQLGRLQEASADGADELSRQTARELAAHALWTDREGAIVWRELKPTAQRRRDALERLLRVPTVVLAKAVGRL